MTVWGHLATRLVPDAALRWARTPAHPATPATPPGPRATRPPRHHPHLDRDDPLTVLATIPRQWLDTLAPTTRPADARDVQDVVADLRQHTNAKTCPTCGRKA